MQVYPSIFNHALSPITPGPSSSNTCGPARIAYNCREIVGEPIAHARIEFSKDGAYPNTYIGMRSDIAFVNGLLGKRHTDPDFIKAYANAKNEGLAVAFAIIDDPISPCIEASRLILTARSGRTTTIIGDSVGGGGYVIHDIDGCKVDIQGWHHVLLVFTHRKTGASVVEQLMLQLPDADKIQLCEGPRYSIVQVSCGEAFDEVQLQALSQISGVEMCRTLSPMHPVVYSTHRTPPFDSPEEMVAYCEHNHVNLYQAAVDYECALSGWDGKQVLEYGKQLLAIIHRAVQEGVKGNFDMNGIVAPKASQLESRLGKSPLLPMGFLDVAVPMALGVMEFSNASGTIVCLPTGGSSGIVPGAIFSAAQLLDANEDQILEGLLAAGMIGVLMAKDNNFSGGDYGCQAEVGCGSAMAAGALVQMMGGTAQQACDAASMALQCQLGMVCDPVAGLVQVPCLARNMSAVSIAGTSANAVMAGFDVAIPFSEVTQAMINLGKSMPDHMKGCGATGCSMTPTGKRLEREQQEREALLRS